MNPLYHDLQMELHEGLYPFSQYEVIHSAANPHNKRDKPNHHLLRLYHNFRYQVLLDIPQDSLLRPRTNDRRNRNSL